MSEEPPQEIYTSRRVKVKGHYRVLVWDSKGRIVSSKKWTSTRKAEDNKDEMP